MTRHRIYVTPAGYRAIGSGYAHVTIEDAPGITAGDVFEYCYDSCPDMRASRLVTRAHTTRAASGRRVTHVTLAPAGTRKDH